MALIDDLFIFKLFEFEKKKSYVFSLIYLVV